MLFVFSGDSESREGQVKMAIFMLGFHFLLYFALPLAFYGYVLTIPTIQLVPFGRLEILSLTLHYDAGKHPHTLRRCPPRELKFSAQCNSKGHG